MLVEISLKCFKHLVLILLAWLVNENSSKALTLVLKFCTSSLVSQEFVLGFSSLNTSSLRTQVLLFNLLGVLGV